MVLRCVCGEAMTSLIILVLSDYWILKAQTSSRADYRDFGGGGPRNHFACLHFYPGIHASPCLNQALYGDSFGIRVGIQRSKTHLWCWKL